MITLQLIPALIAKDQNESKKELYFGMANFLSRSVGGRSSSRASVTPAAASHSGAGNAAKKSSCPMMRSTNVAANEFGLSKKIMTRCFSLYASKTARSLSIDDQNGELVLCGETWTLSGILNLAMNHHRPNAQQVCDLLQFGQHTRLVVSLAFRLMGTKKPRSAGAASASPALPWSHPPYSPGTPGDTPGNRLASPQGRPPPAAHPRGRSSTCLPAQPGAGLPIPGPGIQRPAIFPVNLEAQRHRVIEHQFHIQVEQIRHATV